MDRNDWCPLVGMMDIAAKHNRGSIIEIGCGFGDTTVLLCEIAEQYGEKVIGIDPFDHNPEVHKSYNVYPYEFFVGRSDIAHWIQNGTFHLIRKSSNDPTVLDDLKQYGPFSCAYIDGVQTLDFVLNDLKLMDKVEVMRIGVDDYNRVTEVCQVQQGVEQFARVHRYRPTALIEHFVGTGRKTIILDRV